MANTKSSFGYEIDDISSYFLKKGIPILAPTLSQILNLSLSTGTFSGPWKIARVAPTFREALQSVLTCLLNSTNDWYLNMDAGKYNSVIFTDIKKAFDAVDHVILLQKPNYLLWNSRQVNEMVLTIFK